MRTHTLVQRFGPWIAVGAWLSGLAACGGTTAAADGGSTPDQGAIDAAPVVDSAAGDALTPPADGQNPPTDARVAPADVAVLPADAASLPDTGGPPDCHFLCGLGCSAGDPHIMSFDGAYYDFQAEGEFTAVHALDGTWDVQVRQVKTSACAGAALNDSLAVRTGDTRVIVHGDPATFVRLPDGRTLPFGAADVDLGALRVEDTCDGVHIISETGDEVWVGLLGSAWLNYQVNLSPDHVGAVQGLLGNSNGAFEDDLATADGTPVEATWDGLYNQFLGAWQVTAETSAFIYDPGETVDTYRRGGPVTQVDTSNADPAVLAAAESACARVVDPALHNGCVLDTMCLGPADPAEVTLVFETIEIESPWHSISVEWVYPPDAQVEAATVFAEQDPPDGIYTWTCPIVPYVAGRLWGTDVYTDDSYICDAAVHAGVMNTDTGGTVRFQKLPGQDSYQGSTRHGVTSWDWGAWDNSFSLVP